MLGLNLFLVLFGYYLLKTIRESLILTESGAAVKIYTSAGQAFLLLFLVPAFGAIASKVDRTKLVTWVTLFFVSNILVFYIGAARRGGLGILFFLWVGIFNVMVTAQFWALANDLYSPEQGKRLFAIVGLGSNVGAWVGSLYAGRFIRGFGPYPLMLVAAGVLASCVVVARLVNARHRRHETAKEAAEAERPPARKAVSSSSGRTAT